MRNLRFALSLLLPLSLFLGWVLSLNLAVASGKLIHLKVSGFDPRDLLSGHYLQFRLDFGDDAPCGSEVNQPRCICVTESGRSDVISEVVYSGRCDSIPSDCPVLLSGECDAYGRFGAGIDRYSISEVSSDLVKWLPAEASVIASVSKSGAPLVVDLLVDGVPFAQYVATKRAMAGESLTK